MSKRFRKTKYNLPPSGCVVIGEHGPGNRAPLPRRLSTWRSHGTATADVFPMTSHSSGNRGPRNPRGVHVAPPQRPANFTKLTTPYACTCEGVHDDAELFAQGLTPRTLATAADPVKLARPADASEPSALLFLPQPRGHPLKGIPAQQSGA